MEMEVYFSCIYSAESDGTNGMHAVVRDVERSANVKWTDVLVRDVDGFVMNGTAVCARSAEKQIEIEIMGIIGTVASVPFVALRGHLKATSGLSKDA